MGFELDTSGHVPSPYGVVFWRDLNPFTQGYIEALLASDDLFGSTAGIHTLQDHAKSIGFRHIAAETLARIIEDCEKFIAMTTLPPDSASLGASFWNNRRPGSEYFPPLTITLGDDGKVYATPSTQEGGR